MGDGTGVESCLVCSFCPLFRSGQSLHQTEGVIGRQLAIIAPLETGKVWWAHEGGLTAFTKLWPLRCSMWQCSPKIHGRNSEVCSIAIPNWFDTASSTHDPPPKASVRDAPEPCCCLQEVSVSPEETRRFMGVPIPEVRSKSHEQNSVRL